MSFFAFSPALKILPDTLLALMGIRQVDFTTPSGVPSNHVKEVKKEKENLKMEGLKMKTLALTERKKTRSFNVLIAIVTSLDVALVLTAITLLTMTSIRTFSPGHSSDPENISLLGKVNVPAVLKEAGSGRSGSRIYYFN